MKIPFKKEQLTELAKVAFEKLNAENPTASKMFCFGSGMKEVLENLEKYGLKTVAKTPKKYDSDAYQFIAKQVIEYLNEKIKSKFQVNKVNSEFIYQRISEGFVIDDFKKVIDKKVEQWINDAEMRSCLRPMTLFNKKFENYLNELPRKQSGSSNNSNTGSITAIQNLRP